MRYIQTTFMVLVVFTMLVVSFGGDDAAGYPKPLIVTHNWALDVRIHTPGVIAVKSPLQDAPRLYWFMSYTVTNHTGEDINFVPDILMLTDAGDVVQANKSIPPIVFTRIKEKLNNPLLERHTKVIGRLLQGRDNARDSVAIWAVPDHDVNAISVFFGGLSGETHMVKDPVAGKQYILKKTMMLKYQTPGDASHAARKEFVLKSRQWIVR